MSSPPDGVAGGADGRVGGKMSEALLFSLNEMYKPLLYFFAFS